MGTNTKKNRILITGSNGLLGQKLVELISKDNAWELIATSRGGNRLPVGNYHFREMDITHEDQVMEVISSEKPNFLIHTAAMTDVDQCELHQGEAYLNNVTAVESIIKACEENNVFLIHVSTDFIFSGKEGPLREDDTPAPVNYYGETKLWAEQRVVESRLRWAIARTILVYGIAHDMSRSNIVLWVKNSLESGKDIQVVNDQFRTPTLAEDLATGCFLIAQKRVEGIFNISGHEMVTPYDIAMKTAEIFDLDKNKIHKADSTNFTQPAKRPPRTGFIIDKARKVLSFNPHSFDEGIIRMKNQIEKKIND